LSEASRQIREVSKPCPCRKRRDQASFLHIRQATGLFACWRRYGLFERLSSLRLSEILAFMENSSVDTAHILTTMIINVMIKGNQFLLLSDDIAATGEWHSNPMKYRIIPQAPIKIGCRKSSAYSHFGTLTVASILKMTYLTQVRFYSIEEAGHGYIRYAAV